MSVISEASNIFHAYDGPRNLSLVRTHSTVFKELNAQLVLYL